MYKYEPIEVLEKYNKAIHKVAHAYYIANPRFSLQDLVAEAEIAAINACKSYVEGRNATFFTFLTSSMNREVQKFVKRNRFDIKVTEHKQRKEYKENGNIDKIISKYNAISFDARVNRKDNSSDFSEYSNFHSIVASGDIPPDIALMKSESIGILMQELDSLPDRERCVLNERWLEGKTLEQIAVGFGVTKQTIHGWGKKGFERLQKRVKARLGDELVF